MGDFVMPSLGADMEAGTLVRWRHVPGDRLNKGDIIAEVETDKGLIEVEVFESGVIEKLLVDEGTKVPVGTPLAVLRSEGEAAGAAPKQAGPPPVEPGPPAELSGPPPGPPKPATPPPELAAEPSHAPAARPGPRASPAARQAARERGVDLTAVHGSGPHGAITRSDVLALGQAPAGRLRVSPYARRRAEALGVDLNAVTGTGPGGAVSARDVERSAGERTTEKQTIPPSPASVSERPTPLETPRGRMRQAIGNAMARSKREIPHYYLSTTVDLGPATAWLTERNAGRPPTERLLPGVLFLKAVALALRQVPELNAYWTGQSAPPLPDVHVGVAVSLRGGGLVAPAIHHTDQLDLDALMHALGDLVQRARTGSLRSSEMSDGTITVTSLGDRGVETVFPIIYPPQVAIVGFGKVIDRPWVVEGNVLGRPTVVATLAADHRVSDGHRGGLFLAAVEQLLMHPEKL